MNSTYSVFQYSSSRYFESLRFTRRVRTITAAPSTSVISHLSRRKITCHIIMIQHFIIILKSHLVGSNSYIVLSAHNSKTNSQTSQVARSQIYQKHQIVEHRKNQLECQKNINVLVKYQKLLHSIVITLFCGRYSRQNDIQYLYLKFGYCRYTHFQRLSPTR